MKKPIDVEGYYRSDGKYVKGYSRAKKSLHWNNPKAIQARHNRVAKHAIGLTKPHQPVVTYTRMKTNKPKLQKIERKRNGERVYVYTDGSHLMEYEYILLKDLL